jgi:hypothetical protein
VIWIVVDDQLNLDHFRWFELPEHGLGDLALKVAKHEKGDSQGKKLQRPNHRLLPKTQFQMVNSLDLLVDRLFGKAQA